MQKPKARLLLITPPYHCGVVEVAGTWTPLTLCYLAGTAREAGYEVRIYDAMSLKVGFAEIEVACRDFQPDFVGVTTITATTPDAILTAAAAKRAVPHVKTILGGVHATFMDKEILEENQGTVDYIIRGEGEISLPLLLDALVGDDDPLSVPGISTCRDGVIARGKHPRRPMDLDAFEPAHDLIDWPKYRYYVMPGSRLGSVSTSRGCNQGCTFCSQQKFTNRTWRSRDPVKCAEEVALLHDTYGVDVVLITDELPTHDRARWETFLDAKIRLAPDVKLLMETRASDIVRDEDILPIYNKAGIIHIYIGAEAVDQATLDMIKKDLSVDDGALSLKLVRDHGMITETSFVLGFPDETQDSIAHTLRLAKEFNPDFAHFLAIAPWPYADIYKDLSPYIEEYDYRHYNLVDPVVKPKAMSRAAVDRAIVDCYRQFYMGKIPEIMKMKGQWQKEYLIKSMMLIMRSSFIVSKMGKLGALPKAVEKMMRSLGVGGKQCPYAS